MRSLHKIHLSLFSNTHTHTFDLHRILNNPAIKKVESSSRNSSKVISWRKKPQFCKTPGPPTPTFVVQQASVEIPVKIRHQACRMIEATGSLFGNWRSFSGKLIDFKYQRVIILLQLQHESAVKVFGDVTPQQPPVGTG